MSGCHRKPISIPSLLDSEGTCARLALHHGVHYFHEERTARSVERLAAHTESSGPVPRVPLELKCRFLCSNIASATWPGTLRSRAVWVRILATTAEATLSRGEGLRPRCISDSDAPGSS